jgi:hypothetical protein
MAVYREEYQFDLGVHNDKLRDEAWELVETLKKLIPGAEVTYESCKIDLGILRIQIERVT